MHIFASWPYLARGVECKFSQTVGEEGEEGEEEEDEEEEEEEEEEPEFDSGGDEIPYVKRSRRR